MTELITKMILCLIVALLLGLVIGWLLSKIAQSKKHLFEKNALNNTLADKNSRIEVLEKQCAEKENTLLQHSDEKKELKELLEEKDRALVSVENKLKNQEKSITHNSNLTTENQDLLEELNRLKEEVDAKTKELEELETVLLKAEETIEEKSNLLSDSVKKLATFSTGAVGGFVAGSTSDEEEKLKSKIEELTLTQTEKDKSIALYQETISELENELKLYISNGEEDEFIVSKDQFTHIEEQLVAYQKKIKELKEENIRLAQLSNSENTNDNLNSNELDDIAIVKLFRETYKKITKS